MKNILKSKYVILLIVSMVLLTAAFTFGLSRITAGPGASVDISAIAEADVREVVPAGEYRDIHILNGEEGIFAGKKKNEKDSWYVFGDGKEGERLDYSGYFEKKNKAAALFESMDGSMIIRTGEGSDYYGVNYYEYADIDKDGKYILYLNGREPEDADKEDTYILKDMEGNTVYELAEEETDGYDSLRFSGKEGCLVKVVDEIDILFNMETGEEVYRAPEYAKIMGYTAGYLVVSKNEKKGTHTVEYICLDENFEPVDDVSTATSLNANEELIAYGGGSSHNYFLSKGVVLEPGEYGFDISMTADDSIAFITGDKYAYITIEEGDYKVLAESEYLSRRDFDDGFACAYAGKEQYFYDDEEMDRDENKWGIVDENMKPVTAFKFNGVSKTENGYAVVGIGRQQAVIDLKGVK